MSSRIITALTVLALCALLVGGTLAGDQPTAPNWRAKCADGSRIEFQDALARGPVVVSFWATWCKPCVRELPHLEELQKRFGEKLTVLAVNIDETRSVNKVRPLIKSKRWDLTVPMDTSGDIRRLLQIGSTVPYVILYDAEGHEVYRHSGYKDGDEKELEQQVRALLGAEES